MTNPKVVQLTQIDITTYLHLLDKKIRRYTSSKHPKIYGVPRGGVIVAYLLREFGKYVITNSGNEDADIERADIIIDDIVDSGRTLKKYMKYDRPFFALIPHHTIRPKNLADKWVEFPWEKTVSDKHDNVTRMLQMIGEKVERGGLRDTPARVVKSWDQLYSGYSMFPKDILSKVFTNIKEYDELIMVKNIAFYSMCEHHILPFYGKISIGYVPKDKVVGISKLVRLVHCFARRLQIQENLTQQIANAIEEHLETKGCMVVCNAQHLCMKMRGVENYSSEMVTSALTGVFRENDNQARAEFLSLIK